MNYLKSKFIFALLFTPIFFTVSVSAQNANNILGCPYEFTNDLYFNQTHPDVKILQRILNADKRTIVANSGVGSRGAETNYFGKATRESLKRFQALFIEYTGVADGKFTLKTRTVAQSICNGDYIINSKYSTNPVQSIEPKITVPNPTPETVIIKNGPEVVLSTNVTAIEADTDFRIIVDVGREIKSLTPESFIIDGGVVKSIRKMSKLQYVAIITANTDAKKITVQVEAEKIEDKEGLVNENASNEIVVGVGGEITAGTGSGTTTSSLGIFETLNNVLSQITSTQPATQICNGVQIAASQTCVPTNQSSAAQTNAAQSGAGGQFGNLGQILQGLLGKTGFGGNQSQNGIQDRNGQNTRGPGNVSDTTIPTSEKSELEKAKELAKSKCANASPGDPECDAAVLKVAEMEAKEKASSGDCGGNANSDKEAREILTKAGIGVNKMPNSSNEYAMNGTNLNKLPNKMIILLKKLKEECKCNVMITGATENHGSNGAASHNPGNPIMDLQSENAGTSFTSFIRKFPRVAPSIGCSSAAYNVYGAIFNYEDCRAGNTHWHVDGRGYKCDK